MAEVVAVSKVRHASLTWQRPVNFLFASKDPVVVLGSHEVPRAIMSMAVGFMENMGTHIVVAVQGLKLGQNRFVSRDGRWLGDYIPATYRTYPFCLGRSPEGTDVLCVDEAKAQVSASPSGESFFLPDGAPAPHVAEALALLTQMEKDRQNAQKVCQLLAQHDLLEPWPLKAHDGDEVLEAKGLYRIAERKLYELEPAALAEIHKNGGLMLAFAQLFSMQQIHKLGKLGVPVPGSAPAQPAPKLLDENGIISFANL
jgi:hypothetical protein